MGMEEEEEEGSGCGEERNYQIGGSKGRSPIMRMHMQ
jgi:hypothetical protein